jgi:hypothetical protein
VIEAPIASVCGVRTRYGTTNSLLIVTIVLTADL